MLVDYAEANNLDEAKFLAATRILHASMEKEWLVDSAIVLQVSSSLAVSWPRYEKFVPWELHFIWNELHYIRRCSRNIIFINCYVKLKALQECWNKCEEHQMGVNMCKWYWLKTILNAILGLYASCLAIIYLLCDLLSFWFLRCKT